jgi:hypothetical protein
MTPARSRGEETIILTPGREGLSRILILTRVAQLPGVVRYFSGWPPRSSGQTSISVITTVVRGVISMEMGFSTFVECFATIARP